MTIPVSCPQCQSSVSPGAKFCGVCGYATSPAASTPQAASTFPTAAPASPFPPPASASPFPPPSAGTPFPGPSPAGNAQTVNLAAQFNMFNLTAFGGIGVMFICSFLPWATFLGISVAGTNGDGWFTAGFAVIAGGFLGWSQFKPGTSSRTLTICSLVATVLTFGIYAYDLANVSSMSSSGGDNAYFSISVSPGIGLIVGPIGAIAAIFGLIMLLRNNSSKPVAAGNEGF